MQSELPSMPSRSAASKTARHRHGTQTGRAWAQQHPSRPTPPASQLGYHLTSAAVRIVEVLGDSLIFTSGRDDAPEAVVAPRTIPVELEAMIALIESFRLPTDAGSG